MSIPLHPTCVPRLARRLGRGAAALALAGLLAGCSAVGLVYNQSPTGLYWWLDRLVDFDPSQAPAARVALDELLDWHRHQRLPAVVADLERLGQEVQRDATGEQACGWWHRLLNHRDELLEQATPRIAPIAASLTPAQLRHLEQRFRERDDDWRHEHLQPDRARRDAETLERTVERLERLYGRLSAEQRTWLGDQLRHSPWDAQRWLVERQAHQRITLDSLRQLRSLPPGEAQTTATRRWLRRITQPSSEEIRPELDRLIRHQCGLTAEFHNRTTARQRKLAADRLAGWTRDVRALLVAP